MTKRIAVIDRNLCTNVKCGYVCEKVCPVNRMGQECIVTEKDTVFPAISEQLCIGCGICVKKCPMSCIWIINLAHESGEPIYQYGTNAFRLYGLPLPKEGAVSLVGKNGIGKTTALRLLTRHIVPNFGILDRELSEAGMLDRLKMETRHYFQRVGKELKVSVKPQYVDRVRDTFKGTVKALLQEVGGGKRLAETVELFRLKEILSRKISELSGGELQKVSIAAAWMKESDIYYFDEPTNYLDIEERLRMAVILKELAEKKSVMLAEHDMIILDYVSTYVYLFYGSENVYGMVSGVKNVRNGINEYIAGFLKDENVKFRERELRFLAQSVGGEVKAPVKLRYGALKKSFGKAFEFSSEGGELREGEIIGLLGKNALGKSLLIKMLGGVEQPDGGEGGDFKVSYKPQYISGSDVVVREMFSSQPLDSSVFEEAKRRMAIERLMEKKLSELSGGELQQVALTLAISRDADFYLFDEPSAFLDIEHRFAFAELLKHVVGESKKCAFVVDHDVVFLDSISSRLVVFDGKSSVRGHASKPMNKRDGMNAFLEAAGITMRRDKDTNRPRINKPESVLDREQREKGEYYYTHKE